MGELPAEIHQPISEELGKNALGGVYHQLLLSIIGQMWVEYLAQMESLRISIGLEAYAQRDPLVQYKSRASGVFQELLNSMRLEMVNRMFTYRPRDLSSVQAGVESQDEKTADGRGYLGEITRHLAQVQPVFSHHTGVFLRRDDSLRLILQLFPDHPALVVTRFPNSYKKDHEIYQANSDHSKRGTHAQDEIGPRITLELVELFQGQSGEKI